MLSLPTFRIVLYMSSSGVESLAHYDGKPNKSKIAIADANVISPGVGKRVFFGAQYFANLNPDGVALFDSALEWALT